MKKDKIPFRWFAKRFGSFRHVSGEKLNIVIVNWLGKDWVYDVYQKPRMVHGIWKNR